MKLLRKKTQHSLKFSPSKKRKNQAPHSLEEKTNKLKFMPPHKPTKMRQSNRVMWRQFVKVFTKHFGKWHTSVFPPILMLCSFCVFSPFTHSLYLSTFEFECSCVCIASCDALRSFRTLNYMISIYVHGFFSSWLRSYACFKLQLVICLISFSDCHRLTYVCAICNNKSHVHIHFKMVEWKILIY